MNGKVVAGYKGAVWQNPAHFDEIFAVPVGKAVDYAYGRRAVLTGINYTWFTLISPIYGYMTNMSSGRCIRVPEGENVTRPEFFCANQGVFRCTGHFLGINSANLNPNLVIIFGG